MSLLQLLRPKQWIKQGFVVIPFVSLGSNFSISDLFRGLVAVGVFTGVASCIYIYNDYSDIDHDRSDPIRSLRPLAANNVSIKNAGILATALFVASTVFCILASVETYASLVLLGFYLLTNLLYSKFKLKRQNLIGIAMVGVGFPIRFAFGCAFLGIPYSYWAITMLMMLALFMLSIKRYQMTLRRPTNQVNSNHEFWLIAATTFAAFFSASYAGFVSSPATQQVWGSSTLLISSIPVALGIVRFIELGTNKERIYEEDATEVVAKDLPILILCLLYVFIMFLGKITIS